MRPKRPELALHIGFVKASRPWSTQSGESALGEIMKQFAGKPLVGKAFVGLALCAAFMLAACTHNDNAAPSAAASANASALPYGGPFRPLPKSSKALTRIAFGSCNTAEQPIPVLQRVIADRADLFVYAGDNVYGDVRSGDPSAPELRAQYEKMAANADYQALRQAMPIIATWDDHDYGLNDAGVEFVAKEASKRLFEAYFAKGKRVRAHEGVYDAYAFGPKGERVQILLLDTRWSRTKLARLPERGPRGPYAPSQDEAQRMLSDAQWAWLEAKLKEPATLRIVVSSVQVLADGHQFEGWYTLPREQQRLYGLIERAGARGVIFVSGDRHVAGLYRQEGLVGYPIYELTASALNRSTRETSDERSSNQLGDLYAPVNYALADIDWRGRTVSLQVKSLAGQVVRERTIAFSEIGVQ